MALLLAMALRSMHGIRTSPRRVAGEAEVVLDADLCRVLNLLRRTGQDFAQTAGRHRTGRADLALAGPRPPR
jgi:hypothetical protein